MTLRTRSSRWLRGWGAAVVGGIGLSMSGCLLPPLIVPLIPPVDEYVPDPELVRQATTRADVLMALGCPDSRHHDDRYLVYGWFQVHAFGLWTTSGPAVWDSHRLILKFAPDGRLLEQSQVSAFTIARADRKAQRWIEAAEGNGS